MQESSLERRLVREVKRIGGRAVKWVAPGHRGVPDRIVILPYGRVVFVEMKAQGKSLQPLQEKWFKILKSLGHEVYKLDSVALIDAFVKEQERKGAEMWHTKKRDVGQ